MKKIAVVICIALFVLVCFSSVYAAAKIMGTWTGTLKVAHELGGVFNVPVSVHITTQYGNMFTGWADFMGEIYSLTGSINGATVRASSYDAIIDGTLNSNATSVKITIRCIQTGNIYTGNGNVYR